MPNAGALVITGGAGFIGSSLVRMALAQSNYHIVVVDKLTYAGSRLNLKDLEGTPRYTFIQGDIADAKLVASVFQEHRPQALINLAAETHVDRSIDEPNAFVRTNIIGTFTLLEASRSLLAGLDDDSRKAFRFLHVSTDEVYGTLGTKGAFSEASPYAPNSPYAATKAAADHLVRSYCQTFRLPALVTNCSNNFGPRQFPEKLIPLMILNALEARSLPIYGDGAHVRDWLYVEDHCSGILSVLRSGRIGEHYHIGNRNELTNLQVVEAVCKALEELYPAKENVSLKSKGIARYEDLKTFVEDRPGHDRRYAMDATKIRMELGWRASHSFEISIRETVRWYLDNRNWCNEILAGGYNRQRLGIARNQSVKGS